jgi:hypothetical protein
MPIAARNVGTPPSRACPFANTSENATTPTRMIEGVTRASPTGGRSRASGRAQRLAHPIRTQAAERTVPTVMKRRANLLAVCPRCGFGNSLRVMGSAIHAAQEHRLELAHLWRRDAPVRSLFLTDDERTGARACDFETLFNPIPFFPPFANGGHSIRLLYEEGNPYLCEGLSLLDAVAFPCVAFQHHGPLTEAHLADADVLLLLTSLNLPVPPQRKVEIYQRHFSPRDRYTGVLEDRNDLLQGRWLCVHLRTQVRSAFGIPEWDLNDVVDQTRRILALVPFDRVIVFSDSRGAGQAFRQRKFGQVPICAIDWRSQDTVETMFLDFLAMSRATLILSSGISSFSYEASLFGGGVPYFDMCRGLLVPGRADPVRG